MEGTRPEGTSSEPTDIERAMYFIKHLKNPCEDREGNNLRAFYIGQAQEILSTIKEPSAKKLLEDAIKEYTR